MTDTEYVGLAVELVKKGCGWVNPNPMMSVVVVKDGQIIGQGYHKRYGAFHAKRNVLASCESPLAGVTIYVTLEPCCHYGETLPCADTILESSIRRMAIRSHGPSPQISGEGAAILRSRGTEVMENKLKDECDALNQGFSHYI